MGVRYQAIINGFETMEQVSRFLDWLSNQGEQDPALEEYLKVHIQVDERQGRKWHPSGMECKIEVFPLQDDYDEDEEWGKEIHS